MKKREMALAMQRIVDEPGRTDMEKLAAAFGAVTEMFIANIGNELALARALGDEETAVKEQIKGSVMHAARDLFAQCYVAVTGDRSEVWDE